MTTAEQLLVDQLLMQQSRHSGRLLELENGTELYTIGEFEHTKMKLRNTNAALASARAAVRRLEQR